MEMGPLYVVLFFMETDKRAAPEPLSMFSLHGDPVSLI